MNGPLRIAIVGSGPSGFFTATHLMTRSAAPMTIDMFDRLPTPFGLVRAGVAPDHQKIKSVTRAFDKTATKPGFRYFGNVEIGRDVETDELARWYDAVVYATGAACGRTAGIPGEALAGNHTATDVVGWYNGHPERQILPIDLATDRAVIIGNGNVAIDVARMLTLPAAELATTDIAEQALEALTHSRVREIVVLGRRGPEHAAFTHPELLELGRLPGVDICVDADLDGVGDSPTLDTLRAYANRVPKGAARRIVLRFLTSPSEVFGAEHVAALRVTHGTEVETIETGLIVHAVGYVGTELPGLPFDADRGIIPNEGGRVVPGVYVAGWIKRGASGVIGTNKICASETVDHLLADADAERLERHTTLTPESVSAILARRVTDLVDYHGWCGIDAHERARGAADGRPRIKMTDIDEMVRVAHLESAIETEQLRPRKNGVHQQAVIA